MIQWNYDRERSLILAKYTGAITFDEISTYIDSLGKIEKLPARLYILSDFTEADSKQLYKTKKASKVMHEIKSRMPKYELVKEAILQNSPLVVALSFLYTKFFAGTPNYRIRVFSTRAAAMEWLGF